MMQVDRDQLQTHPMALLCPQHSPAALGNTDQMHGVLPGGGGTGIEWAQSKIRQQMSQAGTERERRCEEMLEGCMERMGLVGHSPCVLGSALHLQDG